MPHVERGNVGSLTITKSKERMTLQTITFENSLRYTPLWEIQTRHRQTKALRRPATKTAEPRLAGSRAPASTEHFLPGCSTDALRSPGLEKRRPKPARTAARGEAEAPTGALPQTTE